MSTNSLRRLSNDDVKAIFDCIYNNKKPMEDKLMFKIIVVGPTGMKLSPPSHEFADGLYILLKPLKRMKNGASSYTKSPADDPRIPSNLRSMVLLDLPKQSCPWSLSGPQFPLPTSIQQRYCYPKGDPEYSNIKGGALWTTYDETGKEDLEYRLLHVYYSAKRAGNKGRQNSATYSTPRKKMKNSSKEKMEISSSSSFPLDVASIASASFDSPLSFEFPSSPVDPSIFHNLFTKSSIDNDENDNEPIITPDRSVFDQRSSHDYVHHRNGSRQVVTVATTNNGNNNVNSTHHNTMSHPTTLHVNPGVGPPPPVSAPKPIMDRRSDNGSSNVPVSTAYPMNQHAHYYHPYSYWPPAPSNPPYHSFSIESQDQYNAPWGKVPPPIPANTKQYQYPMQQERQLERQREGQQQQNTKVSGSYSHDWFLNFSIIMNLTISCLFLSAARLFFRNWIMGMILSKASIQCITIFVKR